MNTKQCLNNVIRDGKPVDPTTNKVINDDIIGEYKDICYDKETIRQFLLQHNNKIFDYNSYKNVDITELDLSDTNLTNKKLQQTRFPLNLKILRLNNHILRDFINPLNVPDTLQELYLNDNENNIINLNFSKFVNLKILSIKNLGLESHKLILSPNLEELFMDNFRKLYKY